jgi:hypothetical protein
VGLFNTPGLRISAGSIVIDFGMIAKLSRFNVLFVLKFH